MWPGSQIVSRASGRSKTSLLKPLVEKLQPSLEKRRLMPLKHASVQIGNAAAFTYCLQQRPCLLPLSQVTPGLAALSHPSKSLRAPQNVMHCTCHFT